VFEGVQLPDDWLVPKRKEVAANQKNILGRYFTVMMAAIIINRLIFTFFTGGLSCVGN